MNKRILEYLSVIMTDTCTTCYAHGDRCSCDKERNEDEDVDESEEDRLIQCEGCRHFACICGDYDPCSSCSLYDCSCTSHETHDTCIGCGLHTCICVPLDS
jgi:hypothetical protein